MKPRSEPPKATSSPKHCVASFSLGVSGPRLSTACGLFGDLEVVAFELTSPGDPACLLPEEREVVRAAGQMRVGHFAAGRACAHAAMEQLGISEAPLLPGPKRRPVWPDGIDGSITHTDGLCIAVVARSDALAGRSLGIDTEHRGRVKPELFRRLFTNAEIAELEALAVADQQLSATIGFCSKEAVYKAQFPITESWVSFTDVGVTLAAGRARAEANPATDLAALAKVRWPMALGIEIRDEHVVAGALAASAAINTAFNPS